VPVSLASPDYDHPDYNNYKVQIHLWYTEEGPSSVLKPNLICVFSSSSLVFSQILVVLALDLLDFVPC
jgi:hypothetical protein